jgi:hypothetical protein
MPIKAFLLLWVLVGLWGCKSPEPILHCQVVVDFSQVPELFDVEIRWDTLALQMDGKPLGPNPPNGHGVLLDPTWVELPIQWESTLFRRSNSKPVEIYRDVASPGAFGRAWPRALSLKGRLASGKEAVVHSILEPITVKFPLRSKETTTVKIELVVVRNLGKQTGSYSLYTKSAYWLEGLSP